MNDLGSIREKRSIGDRALFGGAPAFSDKLHVGRPNISFALAQGADISRRLARSA
jgi:hypothetical protein